ncbi:hypothetical protein FB451DRAFT_1404217 [Mycena latifolia]|nr:hypothetical protein FB451DRAFT_1404217 [Mycena latifolia]
MSPFCAVAAHPEFAIHVRHVSDATPAFLNARALTLCPSITSFRCSTTSGLQPSTACRRCSPRCNRKTASEACVSTQMSPPSQAARLARLREITLDFPSGSLLNALPRWAALLHNDNDLTSLTLYMAHELNEMVLAHTAPRESANNHRESARARPSPPAPLPFLSSLALGARLPPGPAPTAPLTSPPFSSTRRVRHFSHPQVPRHRRAQLLSTRPSLKTLALVDCTPETTDTLPALCGGYARLEVTVPLRDLTLFGAAHSSISRRTPTPTPCAPRSRLALMGCVPSLRTVVSGGRMRTRRTGTATSAGKAGGSLQWRGAVH